MITNEVVLIECGLYDIEICVGVDELKRTLRIINDAGWKIVAMTQDDGVYTVLFWRPRG